MKLKNIIPFVILFGLCFLLYRELFYTKPADQLASTLIGEEVPAFKLHDLTRPQIEFTDKNLKKGEVSLLNVWATWCYACSLEHDMLMKIHNDYHVPIYSIIYKDNPKDAQEWLKTHGNPFILTGNDYTGDTVIDFGVYGTPETFVIAKDGTIFYKHVGVLNQQVWDEVLSPMIEKLNGSS